MRKTLNEIFNLYQTDKGTQYGDRHNYAPVYSSLFEPMRFLNIKLLEIGIRYGNSLLSWHEYFPKATIYAAEIYAAHDERMFVNKPRINIKIGDATDEQLIDVSDLNIIIDDADHALETQIGVLTANWEKLLPGGFYIIEDLFVGEMPWGGAASYWQHDTNIDYKGHSTAKDANYLPKLPQDQPFLNQVDLPDYVCDILNTNPHFFSITSVGDSGGLHMMLVIKKAVKNQTL